MKRLVAGLICVLMVVFLFPVQALATDYAKDEFIRNLQKLTEKNSKVLDSLLNENDIDEFELGIDFEVVNLNANGTNYNDLLSNLSPSYKLKLDTNKKLAELYYEDPVSGFKDQIYLQEDKIIVSKETLIKLNDLFGFLEEIENYPEYIVIPDKEAVSLFQTDDYQNIIINEEANNLIYELINVIPAHCFTFSGNKAILNYENSLFNNIALLKNIRNNSERIADATTEYLKSTNYIADENELLYIREEISQTLKELDVSMFQDSPFSLKSFKITVTPNRYDLILEVRPTDEEFLNGYLKFASTGSYNYLSSNKSFDIDINIYDTENSLKLISSGDVKYSSGIEEFRADIKLDYNDFQDKINLELGFKGYLNTNQTPNIKIPNLTEENSKVINLEDNNKNYFNYYYREEKLEDFELSVYLDYEKIEFSHGDPYNYDGVVMVPLQDIANALSLRVSQENNQITISNDKKVIRLYQDSNIVEINGNPVEITTKPIMHNDYISVRVLAELFDYYVLWDDYTKSVDILR